MLSSTLFKLDTSFLFGVIILNIYFSLSLNTQFLICSLLSFFLHTVCSFKRSQIYIKKVTFPFCGKLVLPAKCWEWTDSARFSSDVILPILSDPCMKRTTQTQVEEWTQCTESRVLSSIIWGISQISSQVLACWNDVKQLSLMHHMKASCVFPPVSLFCYYFKCKNLVKCVFNCRQTNPLHVVTAAGVADDVALLTEHRLRGLTVEGEPALRHADHVLPIHSAFITQVLIKMSKKLLM